MRSSWSLSKLLGQENRVYKKPNLLVLGHMLSSTVVCAAVVCLAGAERACFAHLTWAYVVDFVTDCLAIFLLPRVLRGANTSRTTLLPPLARLLLAGLLVLDHWKHFRVSLYFVPLAAVPLGAFVYKPTGYRSIKVSPFCFLLVLAVCEVLAILKVTLELDYSFASITTVLLYHSAISMFLHLVNLVMAFAQLLRGLAGCFKHFQWKKFAIDLLVGLDGVATFLFALAFSAWAAACEARWESEQLLSGPYAAKERAEDQVRAAGLQRAERKDRAVCFQVSLSCLAYMAARHCLLFLCSKDPVELSQLLSRSSVAPRAQQGTSGANSAALTRTDAAAEPRVQKPSKAQSILSLLRIAPNYFLDFSASPGTQEPLKGAQEKAAGLQPKEESGADESCSICLSGLGDCLVMPCHHAGICKACSISILKQSGLCPFCRQRAEKISVIKKLPQSGRRGAGQMARFEVLEEILN